VDPSANSEDQLARYQVKRVHLVDLVSIYVKLLFCVLNSIYKSMTDLILTLAKDKHAV
jgi:hypothetical protein